MHLRTTLYNLVHRVDCAPVYEARSSIGPVNERGKTGKTMVRLRFVEITELMRKMRRSGEQLTAEGADVITMRCDANQADEAGESHSY